MIISAESMKQTERICQTANMHALFLVFNCCLDLTSGFPPLRFLDLQFQINHSILFTERRAKRIGFFWNLPNHWLRDAEYQPTCAIFSAKCNKYFSADFQFMMSGDKTHSFRGQSVWLKLNILSSIVWKCIAASLLWQFSLMIYDIYFSKAYA